jgi:hypothetical protein
MTNTILAVRCHYCDQLHQVTAADRLQRLGRVYYLSTCPLEFLPGEHATTVVSEDKVVRVS